MRNMRTLVAAASLVLVGTLAFAAPAQAETAVPSKPVTSSDPAVAPAPTPNVSDEFLQQNNVSGDVASVQTDELGAEFYLYDSGAWLLQLPSDAAPGDVTAQFEAGICTGTFATIQRLNDDLSWGGQQSCASAPPTAIYPHSLRMVLRSTCNGFPCGIMSPAAEFTSTDSPYNSVQTVNGFEGCVTSTTYDYDQIAYPTVRGTQYGPFVDSPVTAVACNLNAD